MAERPSTNFVAECFWVGVSENDLRALDARVEASVAELARSGEPIRYLGSVLMGQDEVVLCLFEGPADAVRLAAEPSPHPVRADPREHAMAPAAYPGGHPR
jgi:hypothetical protein